MPSAVIHHHGSAITGRYSDFTVRLGTRNRLRTYLTNMPLAALILTLPGHALATLYLYLRAIGKPYAKALRRGVVDALAMLPDILRRRSAVQKTRTESTWALLKSMTWNPARLHRRKASVTTGRIPVVGDSPAGNPRTQ